MADKETIEPPDNGQLLQTDLGNHVKTRVSREIEDMMECADELRGLGTTLDWHSGLERGASPEAMRETAVGVRAVAIQAFMSACRAAGISARLHSWADVVDILDVPVENEEAGGGQGGSSPPE